MPPPKKDLSIVRDEIISLFYQGKTNSEILSIINQSLYSKSIGSIGISTLKTYISSLGLSRQNSLSYLYDEIKDLFESNTQYIEILAEVNQLLTVRGLQSINQRTLERQLQQWGFKRESRTTYSDELISRIKFYFYHYGYSDTSIVRDLQVFDNIQVSEWTVQHIRRENGMKRKLRTREEREAALQRAIDFLEQDYQESDAILSYGRGYLYTHVRQRGQILISQNRLYSFYREVFPEQVQKRKEATFIHRTNFVVPGPNFLWCLDGYEKLKRYGFQVYACIDAYSRCII